MKDKSIKKGKDEHITCISKICKVAISTTDIYHVSVFLDVKTYIPETLMQKNNMGIICS